MKTPCSNHEMDEPTFDELAYSVKLWAESRDLIKKENVSRQMLKVMEEVGETAASIARGNKELIKVLVRTIDGGAPAKITCKHITTTTTSATSVIMNIRFKNRQL